MDLDLDFETVTAPEEETSLDIESMLGDEEMPDAGEEKEVALETFEERQKQIESEYKKAEPVVETIPEEVSAEETEETIAKAPVIPMDEKRRLKPILVSLLIILAIGAIIYFGFKIFGGKQEVPVVKDQGYLQMEMIAVPEYKFVENKKTGELLVVTGNVTNRYDSPRSGIQVKGKLYNTKGKVLVSATAYCGNMFKDSDLSSLELKTINDRLNNRKGDNNIDAGVKPGQKVPFTVVFSKLPEGIDELTVEVVKSSRE